MIKKLTAVLLSLILMLIPFSFIVNAEGNTAFSLVAPGEVYTDEEFPVNLKISNSSSLKSATIIIQYEESMFDVVSAGFGSVFNDGVVKSYSQGDGKITITFDTNTGNSLASDGILFKTIFIANDYEGGDTSINVSIINAIDDAGNQLNIEQVGVPVYVQPSVALTPGEITTETTTMVTETESSTFVDITTTESVTDNNSNNGEKPSVSIYVIIAVFGVAVLGTGIVYFIYNAKKQKGD